MTLGIRWVKERSDSGWPVTKLFLVALLGIEWIHRRLLLGHTFRRIMPDETRRVSWDVLYVHPVKRQKCIMVQKSLGNPYIILHQRTIGICWWPILATSCRLWCCQYLPLPEDYDEIEDPHGHAGRYYRIFCRHQPPHIASPKSEELVNDDVPFN